LGVTPTFQVIFLLTNPGKHDNLRKNFRERFIDVRDSATSFAAGASLLAASVIFLGSLQAGQQDSGVTGQVFIYVCPVVVPEPDDQCFQPYPTGILVLTRAGAFVTKVLTDQDGQFEIPLRPGRYFLIPDMANRRQFPTVDPVLVHVQKKRFAEVEIVYDSGIR
jgi:hypothetical protein